MRGGVHLIEKTKKWDVVRVEREKIKRRDVKVMEDAVAVVVTG